ncbi:hypothetical protein AB3329_00750 [Streptococcus sp. H31]|uniref:hypothetical protein n=1 Tax=Streptococcus huangxiaojuni TaxID=3237239 RepID=UPI0034A51120
MATQTLIYCYRMTHDYGVNPCTFTMDYQSTPELLTEGGCMKAIRANLKKHWADKIKNKEIDAYIMAVAGHSDDGGRKTDVAGKHFISPKYNGLIFTAKITDIMTKTEYLRSPISKNRRDAYNYQWEAEQDNLAFSPSMQEAVIVSNEFRYFGKSPKVLPQHIVELFPNGSRAMLSGKKMPRWNPKNGLYYSDERPQETQELLDFIKAIFQSEEEPVVDLPYYPIYINES